MNEQNEVPKGTVPVDASKLSGIKVKSQSQIDEETSIVRLELEQAKLEREKLELEKLKHDIAKIRSEREAQQMSSASVQDSLAHTREDRIDHETLCTHMKGGNADAMLHGAPAQGNNQNNYAMIQHSLTTGVTFRMCQRCGKTWFPKDPDYRWAMTRPTLNSPSTGCPSPGLVKFPDKVRVESEVPHKNRPMENFF